MSFRSVESLLSPKSMAIVGISPDPGNWGYRIVGELERHGYAGTLSLVTPSYDEIAGRSTVARLSDLPEAPEHVIALVSASRTADLLEEAGAMGTRAATVLAAGFAEADTPEGDALNEKLLGAIDKYGIAVCGPNCMGLVSLAHGVTSFAERYPTNIQKGSFGLISQSGGMMGGIVRYAGQRDIGFSHAISTGNEVNRDVADFMHFLATDPATTVVGLLLEGIRRPAEFVKACEELLEAGKPLILLRSGRSERGQQAVASHTGALAANGATMDAVIDQLDIVSTASVAEFIEAAELATRWGVPPSNGLAVVALSGGARNMIIDVEDEFDLPLVKFQGETLAQIDELLPVGTNVDNPLDVGMVGLTPKLRPAYLKSLEAVMADPAVGAIAIQEELPRSFEAEAHRASLVELSGLAAQHGVPLAFFSRATYTLGEAERDAHQSIPNPFIQDVHGSMKALGQILAYHRRRTERLAGPRLSESLPTGEESAGVVVSDLDAYRILREHSVPIPAFTVIEPGRSEAAEYVGEWPVALKVIAEGVEHKSDIGGVALNLQTPHDLAAAATAMRSRVGDNYPLLVQQMVPQAKLEIFVSAYRDARFGWILLIGVGGLWAEPLATFSSFILPRTPELVRAAVDRSIIGRILSTSRGRLTLDPDSVYSAVAALCETAADPELRLRRLEVNPLLVGDNGCIAVDIVMEADAPAVREGVGSAA